MTQISVFCNGCFYTGDPDGFKPQCQCTRRMNFEKALANNEPEANAENKVENFPKKDRIGSRKRFHNRVKSNEHANKTLKIVQQKYHKAEHFDDKTILINKIQNAYKKARRNKQISLTVCFPSSFRNSATATAIKFANPEATGKDVLNLYDLTVNGKNLDRLIDCFLSWKYAFPDMAESCNTAISKLELATAGALEGLCKNDDSITIIIGFYNEVDLSNYERKLALL